MRIMRVVLLLQVVAAGVLRGVHAGGEPSSANKTDAAALDYQLQYVAVDLESNRPNSPYDPKRDKCLTVIGTDELGGAGLGYGPCAHYGGVDEKGRPTSPTMTPDERSLFTLLPDGRLQNKRTGWCVRRMTCLGDSVYDVGICETAAVSIFNIWKARSNQAELTEFVGFPLAGVEGACSSCGPFLVKQLCGTKETDASCGGVPGVVGWTKQGNHIISKSDSERYTLSFSPALNPLCGTMVQQSLPQPLDLTGMSDPAPPWYYFHKYKDGVFAL